MRALLLAVLTLAAGCSADYYALKAAERRYIAEYGLDRPALTTPKHGVSVVPPRWLDAEDHPGFLAGVDRTCDLIRENYTLPPGFSFSQVRLVIHDSMDRFVAPFKAWVHGCQWEGKLFVSWRSGADGFPAEDDPLPTLAHETFHLIARVEIGHGDAKHLIVFIRPEAVAAMKAARSVRIPLGERSRNAARAFVYEPWYTPKGP